MFLLIFFILGALIIISNNNLALYKDKNIYEFKNLYFAWIDNVLKNTQIITGKIIKLDWLQK